MNSRKSFAINSRKKSFPVIHMAFEQAEEVSMPVELLSEQRNRSARNQDSGFIKQEPSAEGKVVSDTEINAWCEQMFPSKTADWSQKEAGLWIIEKCNSKGVFDPDSVEKRSVGIWRDVSGNAIMHCGNFLEVSTGQQLALTEYKSKQIVIGAAPIAPPAAMPVSSQEMFDLLDQIRAFWGWKRNVDADILLGWISSAFLGGFLLADFQIGGRTSMFLETEEVVNQSLWR